MNDLEFAIDMERDGEKYYREQAEINKNNSLDKVCLMLADDERYHAQVLRNKMKGMQYDLKDSDTLIKAKSIFKGIGDIEIMGKETPSQLDFYRIAVGKEKQSIDLYTKYLKNTDDKQEKELFVFLIKQEKQHFEVLDNLAELLMHAEDWIESAEFGLRKEY